MISSVASSSAMNLPQSSADRRESFLEMARGSITGPDADLAVALFGTEQSQAEEQRMLDELSLLAPEAQWIVALLQKTFSKISVLSRLSPLSVPTAMSEITSDEYTRFILKDTFDVEENLLDRLRQDPQHSTEERLQDALSRLSARQRRDSVHPSADTEQTKRSQGDGGGADSPVLRSRSRLGTRTPAPQGSGMPPLGKRQHDNTLSDKRRDRRRSSAGTSPVALFGMMTPGRSRGDATNPSRASTEFDMSVRSAVSALRLHDEDDEMAADLRGHLRMAGEQERSRTTMTNTPSADDIRGPSAPAAILRRVSVNNRGSRSHSALPEIAKPSTGDESGRLALPESTNVRGSARLSRRRRESIAESTPLLPSITPAPASPAVDRSSPGPAMFTGEPLNLNTPPEKTAYSRWMNNNKDGNSSQVKEQEQGITELEMLELHADVVRSLARELVNQPAVAQRLTGVDVTSSASPLPVGHEHESEKDRRLSTASRRSTGQYTKRNSLAPASSDGDANTERRRRSVVYSPRGSLAAAEAPDPAQTFVENFAKLLEAVKSQVCVSAQAQEQSDLLTAEVHMQNNRDEQRLLELTLQLESLQRKTSAALSLVTQQVHAYKVKNLELHRYEEDQSTMMKRKREKIAEDMFQQFAVKESTLTNAKREDASKLSAVALPTFEEEIKLLRRKYHMEEQLAEAINRYDEAMMQKYTDLKDMEKLYAAELQERKELEDFLELRRAKRREKKLKTKQIKNREVQKHNRVVENNAAAQLVQALLRTYKNVTAREKAEEEARLKKKDSQAAAN